MIKCNQRFDLNLQKKKNMKILHLPFIIPLTIINAPFSWAAFIILFSFPNTWRVIFLWNLLVSKSTADGCTWKHRKLIQTGSVFSKISIYLVESNVDDPCWDEGSPARTNHGLHGCWRQVLGISVVIHNLHVVMNLVYGVNGQTKVNSQSNSSYLYISSNWWTKESI